MKAIRVSLVAMQSLPGNEKKNRSIIFDFLHKASQQETGLVVFPECCLTGYAPAQADLYALEKEHEEIIRIEKEADMLGLAVCFGFLERNEEGKKPSITQELYYQGNRILYRKTHPGTREKKYIHPGEHFLVMDVMGVKMGIQLCWESHIPDISTILRGQGAELLLVPYASGMSGERCRKNWLVHLPARASDNGVFLVACNAILPEDHHSGSGGGLAVFNPKGLLVTSYFGCDEHFLTCDLEGMLPREYPQGDMHHISYFDRRKPNLYS